MMNDLDFSTRKENLRNIYTAQISKELDVTVAAVNFIFLKEELVSIEFNSYRSGITKYSISEKKFKGNIWESENDAKAVSDLNYHYTSIGLNGTANDETNQKIYRSVMQEIKDSHLTEIINRVIGSGKNMEVEIKKYFQAKIA